MAVRERASMSYPILNGWFDNPARVSGDYVDIDEIRKGTSAYVTEMGLSAVVETTRANFVDMGVVLGDTDKGESVVGYLMGQTEQEIDRYVLAGRQTHPLCFMRIYFGTSWKRGTESRHADTDAREIKFLGSVRL